jgi:putative ABC transport system substrate-binding protein
MRSRQWKRRDALKLLGGAAGVWPLTAYAQQPAKIHRIGYLSPGSRLGGLASRDDAFRDALRELGYIEGSNLIVEYRFADGKFDRLAGLALELAQLRVDVIVAVVTQASLAAKQATRSIPIVMVAVSDPVGSGLVVSLARPGGNVTGTSSMTSEVVGKSLDLLKEMIGKVARVAVLWNPENAIFQAQLLQQARVAAARLGAEMQAVGVRSPAEFEPAFAAITQERPDALLVLADPALSLHQERIVKKCVCRPCTESGTMRRQAA